MKLPGDQEVQHVGEGKRSLRWRGVRRGEEKQRRKCGGRENSLMTGGLKGRGGERVKNAMEGQ